MASLHSVIYNLTLIILEKGCSRSLAGIEGSNRTGRMAVYVLRLLCFAGSCATSRYFVLRSPTGCDVPELCVCVFV